METLPRRAGQPLAGLPRGCSGRCVNAGRIAGGHGRGEKAEDQQTKTQERELSVRSEKGDWLGSDLAAVALAKAEAEVPGPFLAGRRRNVARADPRAARTLSRSTVPTHDAGSATAPEKGPSASSGSGPSAALTTGAARITASSGGASGAPTVAGGAWRSRGITTGRRCEDQTLWYVSRSGQPPR